MGKSERERERESRTPKKESRAQIYTLSRSCPSHRPRTLTTDVVRNAGYNISASC